VILYCELVVALRGAEQEIREVGAGCADRSVGRVGAGEDEAAPRVRVDLGFRAVVAEIAAQPRPAGARAAAQ